MRLPKLFDVVALLKDIPLRDLQLADERYTFDTGLPVGTVGTVVELIPQHAQPSAYLIEFADSQGSAYAFAALPAESLLLLHYTPSEAMSAQP